MSQELPQEKPIVGLASFGLGLILSGRFLIGLLPIAAAVYLYLSNRAAYAGFEKRLTALFGAAASTGPGAQKHAPSDKAASKVTKGNASHSPAPIPVDNWYYERAGAAIGPLRESDIRGLVLNREITAHTLVYNPVFGDEWRKLENTHFADAATGGLS